MWMLPKTTHSLFTVSTSVVPVDNGSHPFSWSKSQLSFYFLQILPCYKIFTTIKQFSLFANVFHIKFFNLVDFIWAKFFVVLVGISPYCTKLVSDYQCLFFRPLNSWDTRSQTLLCTKIKD